MIDDDRREHLGACRIAGPDSCGRVLLVGEDNPLSLDPRYALYHEPIGCAGSRLQRLILAVRPRQTYLPMWRTNLCVGGWDRDAARDRALALCGRGDKPWRVVVALGVRVTRTFAHVVGRRVDLFDDPVTISGGILLVSLPHPSGRNTAWNDASRIDLARRILGRAEPGVPWGELTRAGSGADAQK